MSATPSPAQARPRRTRKSIAHFPSSGNPFDQENGGSPTKNGGTKAGKKSRSKSLGPGGLEALQEASGNRQKQMPAIRSILKPTIPLSPPKAIPPRTPNTGSPKRGANSASPTRRTRSSIGASPRSPGKAKLNGSSGESEQGSTVALRTEEEQQKAARERERQEAIKRRDERRKSLANRRVSFAPEATLHTWDVVEVNEDATTSSEATNSTRRQSGGNTLTSNFTHGTQHAPDVQIDPPSTPPSHDGSSSPEHQRDVHQKKRRRSSTLPQTSFNEHELSSSPTSSTTDDMTQQSLASTGGENEEDEDISDTDTYRDDDSTAMDIDGEDTDGDITSRTTDSGQTDRTSSSSSSGQLDARLRQAVEQASTQDLAMQGMNQILHNESLIDADFAADQARQEGDENEEGMDMTEAVGGIVQDVPSSPFEAQPNEPSPRRRSSRAAKRRSSGVASIAEDETMDFTAAVGGIRRSSTSSRRESVATVATEDEDMSMELTNVVGGVVGHMGDAEEQGTHDFQPDLTAQMDMTAVYGRILSPVTERTEPSTEASESMDFTTAVGAIRNDESEDQDAADDATATMTMDVTKAIGEILPSELQTNNKTLGKLIMEEEAEHGQVTKSPMAKEPTYPMLPDTNGPTDFRRSHRATTTPSHSPEAQFATPKTGGRQTTPTRKATTPTHQMTPQPAPKPSTPSKTPPNRNVSMRRSSPRKLFSQSTRERPLSSGSPVATSEDKRRRRMTVDAGNLPVSASTPQLRRLSGEGADQAGLGSPRVAEILDRRESIGDSAQTFTPQGPTSQGVRFADPQELEKEVDREREDDLQRESGRDALEKEADMQHEDKDATTSLMDMIQSLTPKKKKDLKGRKSLAVGSARGLLGKRPAELDEEDEDDSPKRLKGPDHSPVKSIKLPAPPSKAETIGRLGRLGRISLGPSSGNVGTPTSHEAPHLKASTPKDQSRFRDAGVDKETAPPVSFNQRDAGISPEPEQENEAEFEQLQLQEFLNLINVRFMDLETTKRRHTIAPRDRSSGDSSSDGRRLDDCVAAGVSTVPMLELYQHSCRELKKYISEGRSIVREIEQDTYEENPALFKEYLSAAPDMRAIMDNQFKNVKSHARLLSRAMWYEWRMKLLDGLKDGLVKIGDGLTEDGRSLSKQEELLEKTVPGLAAEHDELSNREKTLQRNADELASCDQEELKEARQQLLAADKELEEKKKLLEELQARKKTHNSDLSRLTERKERCLSEIEASKRLCDEYRGWKHSEVAALKAEVEGYERKTGWAITTADSSDNSLVLSYKKTLSLFLRPSSFQPASSDSSRIRLSLLGDAEPTTQQRFFLQLLRARLQSLDQASTPLREALKLVSRGWEMAERLQSSASDLALSYITDVAITGDESISVTASILLRQMQTRVLTRFDLRVGGEGATFTITAKTMAKVVYGEELKEGNMGEFLAQKIGVHEARKGQQQQQQDHQDDEQHQHAGAGFGRWAGAVRELETRLIARGKKPKAGRPNGAETEDERAA